VAIEVHHIGIGVEGDPLHAHLLKIGDHEIHQLATEPHSLVEGVYGHIPHGGLHHPISGAAGEAHQAGQPLIMAPEPNPQQAVVQGLAHPP